DRDRSRCLRPATPGLRNSVFKSVWKIDARTVLIPRHRITNRLATSLNDPRHLERCSAAIHVHIKVDLSKKGVVYFVVRRRENLKDGRARLGIQAAHNSKYRLTLRRRGSLIDD